VGLPEVGGELVLEIDRPFVVASVVAVIQVVEYVPKLSFIQAWPQLRRVMRSPHHW